jgi:hypothetical protein
MIYTPMKLVALLNILLVYAASSEKETQLQCNWAQNFTDFDQLITDDTMQQQVMLIASEWEGKFAVPYLGVDFRSALTYPFIEINPDMGIDEPKVCLLLIRNSGNMIRWQFLPTF